MEVVSCIQLIGKMWGKKRSKKLNLRSLKIEKEGYRRKEMVC